MCVCVCVCMYVCMYVCVYVCMCVYVCAVADPGGGHRGQLPPPRPGEQIFCILKLRDLYNLAVADSLFFPDPRVM